ncbi:MAG TPA: hemerythrin domain-containing protein [Bauldia sp.]|nr:hemerythrin domain-containing protein [Bauldia sp.]
MTLDLDSRTGWPADLRILLERYPREVWQAHVNLGELARFWLSIHDGFRQTGFALARAAADFREGRMTPAEYRAWFRPRLQTFLGHLEGHHTIEDYQFFPVFSAAEPRLIRGFEVLEADHENIHAAMSETFDAATAFLRADEGDRDAMARAADRYADAGQRLLRKLGRHLADEEDLIVPLILDRGEGSLGMR